VEEIRTQSTKKIWNPKSFLILSVLFSFLTAGILCSLNYGRLGDNRKKWITLSSTILGFIVLMTLMVLINVKSSSLILPINIGIGILFRNMQINLYDEHIKSGGQKASYLIPTLIAILFSGLIIAMMIYSADIPDNSIAYGKNNVYYTNSVSEAEARKLGDYFKGDVFNDNSKIDFKLDKEKDTYVFSMPIKDASDINDQKFMDDMNECRKALSKDVFNNKPVRVDICDGKFKVLKSIK
jgi:hypothetical protein